MSDNQARLSNRERDGGDLLLRSADALDPAAGIQGPHDIVIRDGRIAELATPGTTDDEGLEVVEAEGLKVFPAFVDPHVHFRTPGREDEEDLETGGRAAAAGGFCCVLAMANTDPVVDTAADVQALRERAEHDSAVPIGFLAAVSRGLEGKELTDMLELREAGAVAFSDDGLPVARAGLLRMALQYQRLCGGVIALHEEDPSLSGAGVMHEGPVSAILGMAGVPSISESTMIARDAAIAAYEDARIHVQHLSARESVRAVAEAKANGAGISAEVTPHHLTLTDEAVRGLDARFKMNPPLRSEEDRQALIEGLRDGTIDCIATDHAPHAPEEKEAPFEEAAMGVTGLETAFAVLHTELVLPGVIGLELLIDRLTAAAPLFDLARPSLAKDSEANLVLIDPEAEWTVGEEGYESRSENSCFAGRTLTGRVLMTLAAGAAVYRQPRFAIGAAK